MKKNKRRLTLEERFPYVQSLFESIGTLTVTKEEAYTRYVGYRPGEKMDDGVVKPPTDLSTVEAYLLALTENGYFEQVVIPLGESQRVSQFAYFVTTKGFTFLNRRKK